MIIEYSIFIAVSFIAGIAATLAGFGSSTILIPVVTLFMDVKTAIFLVACFHLFNNLFKVRAFWGKIDFKLFLLFGLPSILLSFTGAMLFAGAPVGIIKKLLGGFLVVFAVYSFIKPEFKIKKSRLSAVIGGSLSGFLAGLIGLGGAIRSAFLIAFNLAKEIYIGTSAIIALVIDVTRVPTYIFTDVVRDKSTYILIPFLIISAYLGVRVGKQLLGKVNQDVFKKIVLAALFLAGIKILFF